MPDEQTKPAIPPAPRAGKNPLPPAAPAPQAAAELSAEELDQLAGAGPRHAHFS
ncbi:hypothetical protein [Pseudoroseomonas cervicalis]|uniref:hypothetical protein n=1 Tax=Teichococcus cervicalis TaxID=204525 RepID=UPI00277D97EE|nr:hypothetical protein [Pseudoroseomonas cervicalis]MDQ1077937.1 hypothetical protein [Pseudoroseomonas cervicalis]